MSGLALRRIGGQERTVGFQVRGEVVGLVVLDIDLEMIQQVLGGAEQVDPGAVGPAGTAAGLAVHRHGP